MDPLQKRRLLFLAGCLPVRIGITYIVSQLSSASLPVVGWFALLPVIGFLFFYLTGSRQVGVETGGAPIWWDRFRPLHALLWAGFAAFAITKNASAWLWLAADAVIGAGLFAYLSPASPFL